MKMFKVSGSLDCEGEVAMTLTYNGHNVPLENWSGKGYKNGPFNNKD